MLDCKERKRFNLIFEFLIVFLKLKTVKSLENDWNCLKKIHIYKTHKHTHLCCQNTLFLFENNFFTLEKTEEETVVKTVTVFEVFEFDQEKYSGHVSVLALRGDI